MVREGCIGGFSSAGNDLLRNQDIRTWIFIVFQTVKFYTFLDV